MGLCPPEGVTLDNGGFYLPSPLQNKIWSQWQDFWHEWVPKVTRKEPFDIVINGDVIDGVHHNSDTQITHNITHQKRIAEAVISPLLNMRGFERLYMVRGTEAHVGVSGREEEDLAKELGAIPNTTGQYARHELWLRVGDALVQFMHHIGTTGSNAYESTAVHKELIEHYVEAAKHREEPPDAIIRSHRHRGFLTSFNGSVRGQSRDALACVTPGWQGKTPFCYRVAGARLSIPQFGGILVRAGDEDPIYIRRQTYHLQRPEVE